MIKLTKALEVRGVEYTVSVDDGGYFYANDATNTQVEASTLEGLREKLMATLSRTKIKIAIPMIAKKRSYEWDGAKVYSRGTITGMHASNGNLLVTWEDGKKEQWYGTAYRPEGLAELQAALNQSLAADKVLKKAEKQFEIAEVKRTIALAYEKAGLNSSVSR